MSEIVDTDDAAWRTVLGPRFILLAAPRSLCAGVVRAIAKVDTSNP